MAFGFIICVLSLASAFGMVILDKIEARRTKKIEPQDDKKEEEESFKLSDLKSFRLPFWLLTISCVCTYMSIFPYIQISSDLMQKKYKLSSEEAGTLFSVPYLISAVASPILGFGIDKVGRRALFVSISSLLLIVAFIISLSLPDTEESKLELIPLVIVGCAYSVYCSAIWGSIPYTV